MGETRNLNATLERLRAVFRGTAGAEVMDTDVAELADLDEEQCRNLLRVLEATGAIERPRSHVFVCSPTSWWTSRPFNS